MDEPIGENLRNLTGHGILSPEEGNSTKALSFLCLLIKLLSMYSHSAREIALSLDERIKKVFETSSPNETIPKFV